MKEQPQNQASGASETTRFFCTRISSAAGVAGELCTTQRKETKHETESKLERAGASALGGDSPRTARRDRRRHCELRKRMLFADAKRQDADNGRVCLRHPRHRRHNAVPPDRRQRRQRHERRRAVEPGKRRHKGQVTLMAKVKCPLGYGSGDPWVMGQVTLGSWVK